MLQKLREAREKEEGFTLIELLVVVIIIGILAAIAIPVFLNQRENAWTSTAESDARNAAIAMESVFTQLDAYPADVVMDNSAGANPIWYVSNAGVISTTSAASDIGEITVSNGVTLTYVNNTNSYTITSEHAQTTLTPDAVYDSSAGGIQ